MAPTPVRLVSWETGGEMLCPGNRPSKKTMQRWFAREKVSPVVHLSTRKSALNAAILEAIIQRRAKA